MNKHESRIIAIAGPKGGVGRSTCAVALARALAARDRRVLLIDENGFAGGLAELVDLAPQVPQDALSMQPSRTSQTNIDFCCIAPILDSMTRVADQWHKANYDDIIVDLRSGFGTEPCDIFLYADLPILLAEAEPTSIRLTTLWLRRQCIRHIEIKARHPELLSAFENRSTWDFASVYHGLSAAYQQHLPIALSDFRCAFILNRARNTSEFLQCRALCHAWGMMFGAEISFVGSLSFDDRRWFFAHELADVTQFQREDPLVREMDSIVREKFSEALFKAHPCLPLLNAQSQPKQFLNAESADQARSAYRDLWEGYRRDRGLVSQIMSHDEIARILAQLEIAHRRCDIDTEESAVITSGERAAVRRLSAADSGGINGAQPSKYPEEAGLWLQQQREASHLTRMQLALKTRISAKILEKIETCDLSDISLPRLQAYLFELSKALGINSDTVRSKFGI